MPPASTPSFCKGDDVYVFYRMAKRCAPQRKYLAVLDPRHGSWRPRTGLADGWVPARVVKDHDPAGARPEEVEVEYSWPHFFTQRGLSARTDDGLTEWYRLPGVMPAGELLASGLRSLTPPASQPELAILTFRWGGVNEIVAPMQWGETGSSVSDLFLDSFVDSAVVPRLGTRYEVWTVYLEDHSDMLKIADTAHLIFGPHHPVRRARRVCAMYHLYPTAFQENCVPNMETGEDGGAALVDQKSFFRMMQAVERAGVPTRFPHPSGLYEMLASKRWTHLMALVPGLNVPPTVGLPRMLVERDCAHAAERGLATLCDVKRQQAVMRGESPPPEAVVTKGVAKLGFSWEALDVKFWEGRAGLELAIGELSQAIEINQEMTGQPHDLETIMLQEYCEHDLEARLYVVEGQVQAVIYTKFCRIKDNREFGDFEELFDQKEAASKWMGGDLAALADGERQCREISERWMLWVQGQTCEMPPAIRFDYFVGRSKQAGQATVWTLEICELGFSMLGDRALPAKVFAAMLRSCLGDIVGEDPQPPAVAVALGASASQQQEGASHSEENGMAPASSGQDMSQPSEIFLNVPKVAGGTKDQQKCSGKYELDKASRPNGQPLWCHTRGDRFLYHGNDGYWYVGDEEERDMKFDCDQGYIRHVAIGSALPHDLAGPWERGPSWTQDFGIAAALDAATAEASAGKTRPPNAGSPSKGKGKSKSHGKGKMGH